MKHIKLTFIISLLFLAVKNINAQNSYLDSSTYYTYIDAPSLSQGLNFSTYSKELIHLDSANAQEKYYSVFYNSKDWKQHQSVYFLRAKNDSVFFSGKLQNESGDSFFVNDLLIYDFSLNAGDTMKISNSASGLNIELLVNSVKDVKYQDNQLRKTQYYTILSRSPAEYYRVPSPFFASQGLGSNYGLLPFKLIRRNSPFWQELISVCTQKNNIVYLSSYFNYWGNIDYCSETKILSKIDSLKNASINNLINKKLNIYPNPINDRLINITISETDNIKSVKIYNTMGKKIDECTLENISNSHYLAQINTKPANGIYFLKVIFDDNTAFVRKMMID